MKGSRDAACAALSASQAGPAGMSPGSRRDAKRGGHTLRRKKQAREKIRIGQRIGIEPCGGGFSKRIGRHAELSGRARSAQQGGSRGARHEGGDARDTGDLRCGAKGGVPAEKLVAPQAGERDFQSCLPRGPRDEIGVHSVRAGLVECADGFAEAGDHIRKRKREFGVLCAEAGGGAAGDFGFAVFGVRKRDGKSVNAALHAAGDGGESGGIDSAREKDSDGDVGDQVAANGIFEQRANGGCR